MNQHVAELLAAIDAFVSGRDRSRSLAERIEGLVLEHFADAPWYDEVGFALAMYAPGEGAPYYGASELAAELAPVAAALRAP